MTNNLDSTDLLPAHHESASETLLFPDATHRVHDTGMVMTRLPTPPRVDWAALLTNRSETVLATYEAALTLAREAIQVWNIDGHMVLSNPASATLFGHAGHISPGENEIFSHCRRENGQAFGPGEGPVSATLASDRPFEEAVMLGRPEGKPRWLKLDGRRIHDEHGHPLGALLTATDITEFIEHRRHLEHLASYDGLTQLPNRLLLAERMRISLARCRRAGDMVAVCMLDLDGFKPVNDSLGHKAGDELLREVAIRLRESIRGDDTVARIGGDEFAILLCDIAKVAECEQTLARILVRLAQPYQVAGQPVRIGASAGVALFPGDGNDPDLLLRRADAALYQAKESGKQRFHFFDRSLDMRLQANRGLLRKIGQALKARQFVLYYQPIVNCRTGRVESVEALTRWRHDVLGLLLPSEFLPLVDRDDLGIALGEWVLDEALDQLKAWQSDGLDLNVSVNISSYHLRQADFVDRLAARLATCPSGLERHLRIEITEHTAMENASATEAALRGCRHLGVGVALDNFGIGYASLQHLKRLPVDTFKIDQSFIQGMLHSPEDLAIVGGVVGFAAPFGCQVIAEGAETIEHVLTLLELGCETIQGFSIARPMPADKLVTWLRAFQPDPLWRLSSSPRPTRDHFELLLAEANHRAWVSRALDASSMHNSGADTPTCPFETWLRKPATRRLGKFDEFGEIERLHADIHGLAANLLANRQAGRTEQAQADENLLLEYHQRLLALLKTLRTRLSRASRRQHAHAQPGD